MWRLHSSTSPQIDCDFLDTIEIQVEWTNLRTKHLDARHNGVHAAFNFALRPITSLFTHRIDFFLGLVSN